VSVAAAQHGTVLGLDLARVLGEAEDGGAVGGQADEARGDLGVLALALVRAEGDSGWGWLALRPPLFAVFLPFSVCIGREEGGWDATYSLLIGKPSDVDTPRRLPRLMDRTRLTRLCTAPWTAWPMPATTKIGVPRAKAQGLC
jgi:hypothetical protein